MTIAAVVGYNVETEESHILIYPQLEPSTPYHLTVKAKASKHALPFMNRSYPDYI